MKREPPMDQMSVRDVTRRCAKAGLPEHVTTQVVNAVAAFDSDAVRLEAVDALIAAWHQEAVEALIAAWHQDQGTTRT